MLLPEALFSAGASHRDQPQAVKGYEKAFAGTGRLNHRNTESGEPVVHSVARRVTDYPCLMGLGKGCRLLGNSTPADCSGRDSRRAQKQWLVRYAEINARLVCRSDQRNIVSRACSMDR